MIKKLRDCLSVNLRMTRELFKASPSYFAVKFIATILYVTTNIFQIYFLKYIIDSIIYSESDLQNAAKLFLIYFMVLILVNAIGAWINYDFTQRKKNIISNYYKKMVYDISVKKKTSYFNSDSYLNHLHNVIYQDGEYLYAFSERLFDFFYSLFTFIFYFVIFAELNFIFVVLALFLTAKRLIYKNKTNKLTYSRYQATISYKYSNQYIRNIFYLKQYVKENHAFPIGKLFVKKYNQNREHLWNEIRKYDFKKNKYCVISEAVDTVITVLNVLMLAYSLSVGKITVGDFNLVLTNFNKAVDHMEGLLAFFVGVKDDSRYMKDIFSIVDSENYLCPKINYKENEASVRFENVSFTYDGSRKVLEDILIDIPLDKKIAVVGENGSGKSTFIKLLLGLYAPSAGHVAYTYNDAEIADTSQLFSTMLQDFRMFALTISENITLKEELNEEELRRREEAIRFSGLDEKINQLPDGIDTDLTGEFSDSGAYLSGGEMQKLAIARAYMMDRPVLILDEPSSNLDPISENELIHRINQLTKNKGVILVTHNMSYAKNVDLVIVFHEGRIVEYGAPDELRERKGYFYSMVEEQMKAGGGSME